MKAPSKARGFLCVRRLVRPATSAPQATADHHRANASRSRPPRMLPRILIPNSIVTNLTDMYSAPLPRQIDLVRAVAGSCYHEYGGSCNKKLSRLTAWRVLFHKYLYALAFAAFVAWPRRAFVCSSTSSAVTSSRRAMPVSMAAWATAFATAGATRGSNGLAMT